MSCIAEAGVPDLAVHAPKGKLWEAAALPQRWLAFSDLHVSHKTRATCLAVLEAVHEEAGARGAGIVFLGDFWHTRGTLPVEPLNEVVGQLAGWRQPTLMLPGNHDQVSLGGEVHALTPLAAANPAIHAFDGPAMFLGALWLPYRRDRIQLEAALAAAAAAGSRSAASLPGGASPLQAVFAHTDIMGAMMNEAYQAHDGLPPDIFPPDIPTYTGHYHKPHTVPGTRITYIGSPYQVTRAESGQRKRLLLLDRSAGWEVAEEVPLDLGPRYFSAAAVPALEPAAAQAAAAAEAAAAGAEAGEAASLLDSEAQAVAAEGAGEAGAEAAEAAAASAAAEFELRLPDGLRSGDRLMLTLPAAAAKQHQKQLKKLEKRGIEVEVFTPPEAAAAPRITVEQGMGPLQLWERYCAWQRLPEAAAAAGAGLLRELLAGGTGLEGGGLEQRHTSIQFEAVEVEGYFSFREPVRYDLAQRGLVVVTGQVMDTAEAGVESNGAGKTALTMAPLWALTGSVDSRAEGSSTARPLLADIIHDGAKRARVRVEGTVNGAPFVVERTANKKSSSVTFTLNGEDLTTQENRLTQERIDEALGADLLGRVVFYGQSDVTALLEASDRAFKQELAKVVDLEVWGRAKEASRRELSARRDALSQAGATLRERQQQVEALEAQLAGLRGEAAEWEGRQAAAAAVLQEEAATLLAHLHAAQGAAGTALALGEQAAVDLAAELAQVQRQLAELQAALEEHQRQDTAAGSKAGGAGLREAEATLAEQLAAQAAVQEQQRRWQYELGAAASAAADAARQVQAAQAQAEAAAAALAAFVRQHSELAADCDPAEACSRLERLLAEEQHARALLEDATEQLTDTQVEAAGQASRVAAKHEQAERAQRDATAARAVVQQLAAQVDAAAVAMPVSGPASAAEARKQLKSLLQRLESAQRRLGEAQGQAQERRQQLEDYCQLSNSSSGALVASEVGSSGDSARGLVGGKRRAAAAVSQHEQHEHDHAPGTVCDRCHQPISRELFQQNVQRLEAAAVAAEEGAGKAESQVAELQQAAQEMEAAVAAAVELEELQNVLAAAQQDVAAREAAAAEAAAEERHAEQRHAELAAAVQAAEDDAARVRAAAEELAASIETAQKAVDLAERRQQLQADVAAAAAAEADASESMQRAEGLERVAQAALADLQTAAAEAGAAVTAAQQQVAAASAQADAAVRLQQQVALLQGQQAQLQKRQRTLTSQMGALAGLSSAELAAAAAELDAIHSSASASVATSPGPAVAGPQADQEAAEAALEAAITAARAALASATDLQQRWRWHQQQPNLPARDAALVERQLAAAAGQLAAVEEQQQALEDEAGVWQQVDAAFLPRGVVNFVVEGVLGDLQAAASRNLSALTSGMTLSLSPCKPSKKKDSDGVIEQIEKIVHVRLPGSLEMRQRSVRQLSGGERRRVALALALGFSELAAQRGRLRSNLVVLDEVMQHLDGEGCLRVAQLLKQLPYDSILVVAQAHSLLTQAFDATDVVVKTGGLSRVEQGSTAAVS